MSCWRLKSKGHIVLEDLQQEGKRLVCTHACLGVLTKPFFSGMHDLVVSPMDNASEGIHNFPIEQKIQADQVSLAHVPLLVVKAGVARGDRLERVIEIPSQLGQRQCVPVEPTSSDVLDCHGVRILLFLMQVYEHRDHARRNLICTLRQPPK